MERTLLPVGSKISSQRHLAAVRDGMTVLIPLTIIGGFACLLAVPPVPAGVTESGNLLYTFLLAWQAWANSIKPYLMIPYQLTTGSLPSVLLITTIVSMFWFFGIHGDNMVSAIVTPITTTALAENLAAYTAGQPLPFIYAGSVSSIFGGWMTFTALQLLMLTVCKSKQLTSLVKVSLVPSCFNINEPGVFGIPFVLNVYLLIPTTICHLLNFTVYYICASIGLVGKFFMTLPFTTPGPIAAFLATMDWRTVVLWFILLAANYFIVLPFMKAYDKTLCAAEEKGEE